MSKGAYVGVEGVAQKVKKAYIGVEGVARKIKKAYIGVDGTARLWYSGSYVQPGEAIIAGQAISPYTYNLCKVNGDNTVTVLYTGPFMEGENPISNPFVRMAIIDNTAISQASSNGTPYYIADIENPTLTLIQPDTNNSVVYTQLFVFKNRFFMVGKYTVGSKDCYSLYYSSNGLTWTLCKTWSYDTIYYFVAAVDEALGELSIVCTCLPKSGVNSYYDIIEKASSADGTVWNNAATAISRSGSTGALGHNFIKKHNDIYYWKNNNYLLGYGADYGVSPTYINCAPSGITSTMTVSFMYNNASAESSCIVDDNGALYIPMYCQNAGSSSGPGSGGVGFCKVGTADKSLLYTTITWSTTNALYSWYGHFGKMADGHILYAHGMMPSTGSRTGSAWVMDKVSPAIRTQVSVPSNAMWYTTAKM